MTDYINQLQLIAFFSGYPLIYILVNFLAITCRKENTLVQRRWIRLLPVAYALVGTLFIGLLLKNISPELSLKNISAGFHSPYLEVWGIMAILFWVPALGKKPVFSLLHSLPFFLLLIKDFILQANSISGRSVIENDMKMYSLSILLNTVSLVVVFGLSYGLNHFHARRNHTAN